MLIGVSHPSFGATGGAEILLARQIAGLRARGHRVRLVTMALDETRWPTLPRMAEIRLAPKHWTDAFFPVGTAKLRRRVARQAARLAEVDAVLASGYPANLVAVRTTARRSVWYCNEPSRRLHFASTYPTLAARVRRVPASEDSPLYAHVRCRLAAEATPDRRLTAMRLADRLATAQVDRIVANSGYAAQFVRRVYQRDADAVVYPTVPLPPAASARRDAHVRGGLRVLVHSRLELMKNIDPVLHGFARFAVRVRGSHELHVAGTGPDRARLESLGGSLLGDRVHFHGFVHDEALEALYARCHVMALVPPDEPFGLVFPEAALRGLLLVGPDHGGPCEILGGGTLGWTVDAFDPEAIAAALEEVACLSPAEAACRRRIAADACRARYCDESTVPALLAVLEDGA